MRSRPLTIAILLLAALPTAPPRVASAAPADSTPTRRFLTSDDLIGLNDIGGYVGTLSVAPDGTRAAFEIQRADLATNRYRSTWWSVSVADRRVTPIADGGESIIGSTGGTAAGVLDGARTSQNARWSPDSRWVAFVKKVDDRLELWRARADGTRIQRLTHGEAHVEDAIWSADGTALIYSTTPSEASVARLLQDERDEGFLVDDRFDVGFRYEPMLIRPEMLLQGDTATPSEALRVVTVETGADREATPSEVAAFHAGTSRASRAGSDASASRIAWIDESYRGDRSTWLVADPRSPLASRGVFASSSPDRSNPVRCTAPACTGDISGAWWIGDSVYFVRSDRSRSPTHGVYGWDPRTGRVARVLATDDRYFACDDTASGLACLHEGWTRPRAIALLRRNARTFETLYDPNPQLRDVAYSRVEPIFQDVPGGVIRAHLVYPTDYRPGQRYPLVLVQYISDGFLRGGSGDTVPIHALAAQGMFVLSLNFPDLTGLPNGEALPADYDHDFRGLRTKLDGYLALIDRLVARGFVDGDRVGITGMSSGAELVHYAITRSDRFAAASTTSGFHSPHRYFTYPRYARDFFRSFLGLQPPGSGGKSDERWNDISAEMNAERIHTPLLMQVADHEATSSVPLLVALQEADRSVEMYLFLDEYHTKWQPRHRRAEYRRNVDWMNFWLRGVESGQIQDDRRYGRWRQMRDDQCRRAAASRTARGAERAIPGYCTSPAGSPASLTEPATGAVPTP